MSATIIVADFRGKTWATVPTRELELARAAVEVFSATFPSTYGFPEDQHTTTVPNDYDPRKPA